jgi:hypothetical protein
LVQAVVAAQEYPLEPQELRAATLFCLRLPLLVEEVAVALHHRQAALVVAVGKV